MPIRHKAGTHFISVQITSHFILEQNYLCMFIHPITMHRINTLVYSIWKINSELNSFTLHFCDTVVL
jgi:hypothetical protein